MSSVHHCIIKPTLRRDMVSGNSSRTEFSESETIAYTKRGHIGKENL